MAFRVKTSTLAGSLPLYTLSLRSPGPLSVEFLTYTFPITPGLVRKEPRSLSAYWDTQGGIGNLGVSRVPDIYGIAPPTYMIEGTTGKFYHSADGYALTGLQSLQALDSLINLWGSLNQAQAAAGSGDTYTLEFYDYFTLNFWQVIVDGAYGIWHSKERPELGNYRFRLVAIQGVAEPIVGLADLVLEELSLPPTQAASAVLTTLASFASNYSIGGFADATPGFGDPVNT